MTQPPPTTLASRLVETGGYGAALFLLLATLVGVGFLGSGPVADGIGLAIATAALVVVLATATARGRAWPVVAATGSAVAVLAIAVDLVAMRPFLWLAWLVIAAISIVGFAAVTADLLLSRRVSPRLIAGTACLYVLAGYAFAAIFGVIDRGTSVPLLAQAEQGRFADLLYFSFSTLTTTGFGDLTVADPGWHMLSSLEAVIGQLYLVVLVGALIGSWRPLPSRDDRPVRPQESRTGPAGVAEPAADHPIEEV
jgi:hypothetical protein